MSLWVLWALLLKTSALAAGEKLILTNGYAFVDAWVNGKGPFRMLLDTGNTSCALTPKAARKAGLIPTHRVLLASANGERTVPASTNTHVVVGASEASDVEILTNNLDGVRQIDSRVDGILGQSFLARTPYLIDYREKQIFFHHEATTRANAFSSFFIAQSISGRLAIPVTMAEGSAKPFHLVVDSGASHIVLNCGARCPRLTEIQSGTRLATNAGNRRVQHGTLAQVTLGGIRLSGVQAALLSDSSTGGQEDGVLPAQWFAGVYVDSARNEVRLAQN